MLCLKLNTSPIKMKENNQYNIKRTWSIFFLGQSLATKLVVALDYKLSQ